MFTPSIKKLDLPSQNLKFVFLHFLFQLYLQARMTWDGSKLLKHTLQFLALTAAIFTAMTRVSDYKHHWSDVLAGVVFGVIAACLVVTCDFILYFFAWYITCGSDFSFTIFRNSAKSKLIYHVLRTIYLMLLHLLKTASYSCIVL